MTRISWRDSHLGLDPNDLIRAPSTAGVREKTPSFLGSFRKGPRPLSDFLPAVCPGREPPRHRGGRGRAPRVALILCAFGPVGVWASSPAPPLSGIGPGPFPGAIPEG